MKKLGKLVQKILTIIVVLLILGTIGIFVYPSIAGKTDLDDKAVSFLAKQADKLVEETTEAGSEGEEVGTEVNADGEMADEDSVIEEVVVSKPADGASIEEVVQDDSRTQTWTAEEKEALKKVYGTILKYRTQQFSPVQPCPKFSCYISAAYTESFYSFDLEVTISSYRTIFYFMR